MPVIMKTYVQQEKTPRRWLLSLCTTTQTSRFDNISRHVGRSYRNARLQLCQVSQSRGFADQKILRVAENRQKVGDSFSPMYPCFQKDLLPKKTGYGLLQGI